MPNAELGPDTIGEVVTTDLVVRSLPEISDASAIFEQSLDAPTLLYVIDGPVTANGYDWYQVQPFGMHYLDFMQGQPPFGWVAAASREGEPWVTLATLDCPEPEVDGLRAMTDIARFACYGDDELIVEGQFGGCFVSDPAFITPGWLYQSGCALLPRGYRPAVPDPGGLPMRVEGEVGMPFDDPSALIRATGHFDDPAARTCLPTPVVGNAPNPIAPEMAILLCRAQFVVTHVERIDG